MQPILKTPTLSATPTGDRDLVWVLPTAELAERFEDILFEETGLTARVCGISGTSLMVKVTYPLELMCDVLFAIFLLVRFYKRILPLEAAYRLSLED
jgi:hypothetical protein